jgi:DNA-binding LacI/PurR family transcriptional regulator/biotin operon repressor
MKNGTKQSKRERLKEAILFRLASGDFTVGDRIASEREIAAQFKLSRVTVRAAIDELVKEGYLAREARVGTIIMRLPQLAGNGKADAVTDAPVIVYVCTPSASLDSFDLFMDYWPPFRGAQRYADQCGAILSIQTGANFDRMLSRDRFHGDGVMISGTRIDGRIDQLMRRGIPMVSTDYFPERYDVEAVASDALAAGRIAAAKVAARGAKSVVFVLAHFAGEDFVQPNYERSLMGLRAALPPEIELDVREVQVTPDQKCDEAAAAEAFARIGQADAAVYGSSGVYDVLCAHDAATIDASCHVLISSLRDVRVMEQGEAIFLDAERVGYLACKRLCEKITNPQDRAIRILVPPIVN